MKIAVFASGNGSNFQVIAEQFPVEFVFSDHRDAYVLERAKNLGVTSHAFELKEFDNKVDYEEVIVKLLDEHQTGQHLHSKHPQCHEHLEIQGDMPGGY